jgi:hypothetical protein
MKNKYLFNSKFKISTGSFCYKNPPEGPAEKEGGIDKSPKKPVKSGDVQKATSEVKKEGEKAKKMAELNLGALEDVQVEEKGKKVDSKDEAKIKNVGIYFGFPSANPLTWGVPFGIKLEKYDSSVKEAVDEVKKVMDEKVAKNKYDNAPDMETAINTAINSMPDKYLIALKGLRFTLLYPGHEVNFKFLSPNESSFQKYGIESVTVRKRQNPAGANMEAGSKPGIGNGVGNSGSV